MEKNKKKKMNMSLKVTLMVEAIILISSFIFGAVSISLAKTGIVKSIRQRMLEIANCASGSVNGDVLGTLTAKDVNSTNYRAVYNALAVFRDNVELEYVYAVKAEEDGTFTFTVDPDLENAAEFGDEVVYTDALAAAAKGTPSVDETPYTDAWGSFYGAYSPVLDSAGNVAGIVAVDFSVKWFESQLEEQKHSTVVSYIVILLVTLFIATILSLAVVKPYVQLQEQLSTEVAQKARENEQLFLQVVHSLADAIDAKDEYTNGHSGRVAAYSKEIARRYGYEGKALDDIYIMGLLHDVGKIGVPDNVINKPSSLTPEEYDQVRKHSVIGAKILENIEIMEKLSEGARWHHERFDGAGYPDGLKETDIPEEERIIALADAYDAMTSNRSYRKALPQARVREEIESGKGKQFDPAIADVLLAMIDEDVDYRLREGGGTQADDKDL